MIAQRFRRSLLGVGVTTALFCHGARAGSQPGGPPAPPGYGSVRGQLHPDNGRSAAGLRFQVDGVPQRVFVNGANFTMRRVLAGDHIITILDPRRNRGAYVPVTVPVGGTALLGTVRLLAGGTVAGTVRRVVNVATGQVEPLAGVDVMLEPEALVLRRAEAGPGTRGIPKGFLTRTDAGGQYQFDEAPPGAYRVSVVVPGLEAGLGFAFIGYGQTATVDLFLRPAIEEGVGTLTGTVTGPNGAPLEGALVTVVPEFQYFPPAVEEGSRRLAARLGRSRLAAPGTLPRGEFSTLTDRQGQYRLNVPSGYLSAIISADGFEATFTSVVLHPRETRTFDAQLAEIPPVPLGAVEGVVRDGQSNKPVPGALVQALIFVIDGGETRDDIFPPPPPIQVVTDHEGRYRLESLPVGTVQIQVSRAGFRTQILEVDVNDGGTATLNFTLTRKRRGP